VLLVPEAAFRALQTQRDSAVLYLNPKCQLRTAQDLPEEFVERKELLSGFTLQGTIAWVPYGVGDSLLPFWLGPELERIVRGLRPDQAVPPSVPESAQRLLAAAGILLPDGHASKRSAQREEMIEKAATLFRTKGYAPLAGLIHPFHIAALRRYCRYLIRSGAIQLGDGQSPLRYVAYQEPVARFFHHQIVASLSAVAGESLKPSYVYLASYLSGAELRKHTDRQQCEFSVTLCLDFSPEPVLATPWPIRLDTSTGTVTIYQALGDGLAYRGTQLPHYREKLGPGKTSTSVFFHYVSSDFKGSLD
jgi:hypothetical protein